MGNVGIAYTSDDPSTASFYNPAALTGIKKPSLEIFNPQLEVGSGDFKLSHSLSDMTKETSLSKGKPLLLASPGTASSLGGSVFPNFSAQNFDIGVLASEKESMYYDAKKGAYYYHSENLVVPSLGLSASALGGRFRVGVAARAVQINEVNMVAPASTSSTVANVDNARDGLGFALDGGALLTMPWTGLPTLGFVARNIGGTSFSSPQMFPLGSAEAERHEIIKMTYDSGMSFTPKVGQKDTLAFSVDYRDVLNVTGVSELRHFNAGMEFGFMKTIYFRGGFSQGYWTAGFGLNSKIGSFDLGTYGEELDPTAFDAVENRRYSLRMTRRF
jgi:hypothetical protein